MRPFNITLIVLIGVGLAGCSRDDNASRQGATARQAGRDAYRASQEAKRDAKEAARELQRAGKDFRQGWNEAKHENDTRHR
jgi:hypothetical protein